MNYFDLITAANKMLRKFRVNMRKQMIENRAYYVVKDCMHDPPLFVALGNTRDEAFSNINNSTYIQAYQKIINSIDEIIGTAEPLQFKIHEFDKEDKNVRIKFEDLFDGLFKTYEKSQRLFDDAKLLFDNDKFESAIILFIISIEESSKAHEFGLKLSNLEHVSKYDWNDLNRHKIKLNHMYNLMDGMANQLKPLNDISNALNIPDDSYSILQQKIPDFKLEKFSRLKEICLYQDWNKNDNTWIDYNTPKIDFDDLAYFVMKNAERYLIITRFEIERAINQLRRFHNDGLNTTMNLDNPKYPLYIEIRDDKDYSIHMEARAYEAKIDHDSRYQKGEKIYNDFSL